MLESFKSGNFKYEKLSQEEQEKRGILGRLEGPIADFVNPTRNGRLYTEALWDKVAENPIMKEKIENRLCFGELGHPQDRQEIDMEKIAVCLAEMPKKCEDGNLYGVFDILNTPNGKILKTLCDYGSTVGISSRGQGDIITDDDGNEEVDPDTYEFECFDVVLIPAVETARMNYVTESLDKPNKDKGLKKALKESLDSASDEDKKVMESTLNELGIDVEDKKEETKEETNTEDAVEVEPIQEEANNDGSDEIIKNLQEALRDKTQLEKTIKELQEKLAVRDSKVNELNEELGRYKNATSRLSTYAKSSRELSKKVSALEEELNNKDKLIESLSKKSTLLAKKSINLDESFNVKIEGLNAKLNEKDENVKKLTEALALKESSFNESLTKLNETIKDKDETISKLKDDLNESVANTNKYKKLAQHTVNRYIESKAVVIGVSANEIKNRLGESYTISDIDQICEDLQNYTLNISKLPFNFDKKKNVKVQIKESTEGLIPKKKVSEVGDDDIDEGLIKMAGLDK